MLVLVDEFFQNKQSIIGISSNKNKCQMVLLFIIHNAELCVMKTLKVQAHIFPCVD